MAPARSLQERGLFPSGVMFHHFTDGQKHPKVQGSLSPQQFEQLLTANHGFELLPALEWADLWRSGQLAPKQACITFDDALLSQYEVAEPVLRKLGLTAMWFVYSSVFEENVELFEVHRIFRNKCFSSVDHFYSDFFRVLRERFASNDWGEIFSSEQARQYLNQFSFYTHNDRVFRYIRDQILSQDDYDQLMLHLMAEHGVTVRGLSENIWMTDDHLTALRDAGHVIGLHSYTHPVNMARQTLEVQIREYFMNALHLAKVLGSVPKIMAHPSNSYSPATLEIMRAMDIEAGFRSDAGLKGGGAYELPRMDHKVFNDNYLTS